MKNFVCNSKDSGFSYVGETKKRFKNQNFRAPPGVMTSESLGKMPKISKLNQTSPNCQLKIGSSTKNLKHF